MKNRKDVKSASKHTLHAKLGPVCFATLLALGMVETANAAITADISRAFILVQMAQRLSILTKSANKAFRTIFILNLT